MRRMVWVCACCACSNAHFLLKKLKLTATDKNYRTAWCESRVHIRVKACESVTSFIEFVDSKQRAMQRLTELQNTLPVTTGSCFSRFAYGMRKFSARSKSNYDLWKKTSSGQLRTGKAQIRAGSSLSAHKIIWFCRILSKEYHHENMPI